MEFKYTADTEKAIKQLRNAGIAIQTAGVRAVNSAALQFQINYRLNLTRKLYRIRNKNFTLNSIIVIPASTKGKGGALRPLDNIYSTVGVKKIKGTQEHYLVNVEEGKPHKGQSELGGSVGIPLDTARQGGNREKQVSSGMRIKGAKIDGVIDLSNFAGKYKQQYAIMANMARRNKFLLNGSGYSSGAQFYIADFGDKKYLYKIAKGKILRVRNLSKDIVEVKERPMFEETTNMVKQADMSKYFVKAAEQLIQEI